MDGMTSKGRDTLVFEFWTARHAHGKATLDATRLWAPTFTTAAAARMCPAKAHGRMAACYEFLVGEFGGEDALQAAWQEHVASLPLDNASVRASIDESSPRGFKTWLTTAIPRAGNKRLRAVAADEEEEEEEADEAATATIAAVSTSASSSNVSMGGLTVLSQASAREAPLAELLAASAAGCGFVAARLVELGEQRLSASEALAARNLLESAERLGGVLRSKLGVGTESDAAPPPCPVAIAGAAASPLVTTMSAGAATTGAEDGDLNMVTGSVDADSIGGVADADASATLRAPAYIQLLLDDPHYDADHKKDYVTLLRAYTDGTFRAEHAGVWVLVKDAVLLPDGYLSEESAEHADVTGCTMHQIGHDPSVSYRAFRTTASLGPDDDSGIEPLMKGASLHILRRGAAVRTDAACLLDSGCDVTSIMLPAHAVAESADNVFIAALKDHGKFKPVEISGIGEAEATATRYTNVQNGICELRLLGHDPLPLQDIDVFTGPLPEGRPKVLLGRDAFFRFDVRVRKERKGHVTVEMADREGGHTPLRERARPRPRGGVAFGASAFADAAQRMSGAAANVAGLFKSAVAGRSGRA